MLLYRLETQEGEGVYSSDAFGQVTGSSLANNRHPMPYEDYKLQESISKKKTRGYKEDDFYFAFRSKSQCKRWVYKKEWRDGLTKLGVTLNVYEVPINHAMLGNNQCTFNRSKAKLVNKIYLTEI